MPSAGSNFVEQTVSFTGNTYILQERYRTNKKETVTVSKGTWTPAAGYVWLYKDGIVNGRYTWKGDTLQYYSPDLKKNFSMQHPESAMNNGVLLAKKKQGVIFYGVGNEPFWSVELAKNDTLSFSLPEWQQPLKLKVKTTKQSGDSTLYFAEGDSLRLNAYVLPYFSSDGMSDFIYSNTIGVRYYGKLYKGCGIKFR